MQVIHVEDDELDQYALARQLRVHGITPTPATDGQSALELLDTLPEGSPEPVIVLDMLLPVMDGVEFLEQFRSRDRFASAPVYVLSGHDAPPEELAQYGVEGVWRKGLAGAPRELIDDVVTRMDVATRAG